MASLPARQQSQPRRRSSPSRQSQTSPSPTLAHSEDSQTLFVNSPDQSQTEESTQLPSQPQPIDRDSDPNIQKCWICFSDSTEDTPETSPWRDPCPCALVAHEECLLDWIADAESPSNARRARAGGFGGPRIECPQCKHEIKLARPWNPLVEAVRGMERIGAKSVTPGALSVLSGILWNASSAWGVHSIYAIFGPEDGFRILRPWVVDSIRVVRPEDALHEVGRAVLHCAVHWRLYVGLPLITPVLVLSRTRFADSVLPVLPILFFATQTHTVNDGTLNFTNWPPSASLSFAVLPYIRSAYNYYYEKVWAEKERRWLKEIQPRTAQLQEGADGDAGAEGGQQQGAQGGDADNIFEVRIDGGIWEEWGDADAEEVVEEEEDPGQPQPDAQQNRPAPQVHPPEVDGVAQVPPPPGQAHDNQGEGVGVDEPRAPQPQLQRQHQQAQQAAQAAQNAGGGGGGAGERRLSFSPTAIAETVLGALLFPTLAGLSGELLKLALPRSWTSPGPSNIYVPVGNAGSLIGRLPAKGLLQEKWGRSLVGGCLFVVVKDCVMLYVRWKMASMHRERRVVDFDRRTVRSRN
ncbi:hypothetical protein KC365_g9916 [Hortaea werneckii]|nr:hypothetical protein KC342_g3317 [Hortaea werneckii]KAI7103402.1 hypothetical protein KC339_g5314 [Hortaea werneckii]KAI7225551.1 hypothetical protein KC365_g9916 [Hortaea werneckii]